MTAGEAARAFCLLCGDGVEHARDVRSTGGNPCKDEARNYNHVCLFHENRLGTGRVCVWTLRDMCLCYVSNSSEMNKVRFVLGWIRAGAASVSMNRKNEREEIGKSLFERGVLTRQKVA